MCLVGVVVRRYIDFLTLLIPTPLVSVLFCSSIPTFCSFKKMFFVLYNLLYDWRCLYYVLHIIVNKASSSSEIKVPLTIIYIIRPAFWSRGRYQM